MAQARVLIAEDDRVVARSIDELLGRLGYAVLGVTQSGEGAVRLAADLSPDLVLMDIQLAGATDGVRAAQLIRERSGVPVVYLTAYADPETLRRASITEPFGYVVKPFEERELHAAIEMALAKHAAERRLRESERRYAATLNSIGDAVITTDTAGRVTFLNPVAEGLTGWRQAEAFGRPLGEVFPVAGGGAGAGAAAVLTDGAGLLTREGREVPIDASAVPIVEDRGGTAGTVVVFRDVSERKRREGEIRLLQTIVLAFGEAEDLHSALEMLLRRVCEATGWVLGQAWLPDPGHGALACSPAWYCADAALEPFRRSTEGRTFSAGVGLPGRVWAARQPAWIRDVTSDASFLRAAAARQVGLRAGMGIPVLAGKEVIAVIEFFVKEPRAADEALLGLVGSVATQLGIVMLRKQAEEKLRRSQQRYEALVNSVDGIVWEADPQTLRLRFVSRRAERLLGYPIERWRAEPTFWQDHVHPEDRERALCECLAAAREGRDHEFTYRMVAADGREVWLNDRVSVVSEGGRVLALRGVMVDVTRQKRLEAQLRQAQKMDALGRLAGGVAHDFNNLLTVINGYGDMLLAGLPPGDSSCGAVEEIREAGDRAAGLTRQLLAFSRQQVLQSTPLNLNNVVAGMQRMLARLIGEDVVLTTRLADGLGLVMADLGQMEQVILNLAVNARDAMPGGGQLTLETADADPGDPEVQADLGVRPGRHVRLAVSDTGCGMDAATRANLFEPFFTTKEAGKGTGLGLATVYGIISQSGGHVAVSSEPGRGTTFRIYLPRAESPPAPAPRGTDGPEPPGGSEVVLLVEDDASVRELFGLVLRRRGYTVLEAGDGAEALEVCGRSAGRIDLVVTDVVLPRVSGPQLVAALAGTRPGLKVLYLSGYPESAGLRCDATGAAEGFLQKPFVPAALARAVRAVLDR